MLANAVRRSARQLRLPVASLDACLQRFQSQESTPNQRETSQGPGLSHFVQQALREQQVTDSAPSVAIRAQDGVGQLDFTEGAAAADEAAERSGSAASTSGRSVFVETYGCSMNVSDTEVVLSVLAQAGYSQAATADDASVVLVNTCAIRDGAEQRVHGRLGHYKHLKQQRTIRRRAGEADVPPGPLVGVLGCMAERLKHELLDGSKVVDLVAGPDAYRDLPRLLDVVQGGSGAGGGDTAPINVQLSLEETYADIVPLRPAGVRSAFLSIMRGCNNLCSFCIVPFTRGRERSRPMDSILEEVRQLADSGVREVILLGQNVNSYADWSEASAGGEGAGSSVGAAGGGRRRQQQQEGGEGADPFGVYARGFRSVYKPQRQGAVRFAELLHEVAGVDPEMRVRFTSPHPKDFADEVLQVIADQPNVCSQLHMPAQSGSSTCLERMRRGYTREAYDELVAHARDMVPGVALSSDIIVGFCGETDDEFEATLGLMERTRYDNAFMFAYSQRARTHAARHLPDDVPAAVKAERLQRIIAAFRQGLAEANAAEVGRRHVVLLEGPAKRGNGMLTGRTCSMKRVVFADQPVPCAYRPHDHSLGGQQQPVLQDGQPKHPLHPSSDSSGLDAGATRSAQDGWALPPPLLRLPCVGLQAGDYVAVQVVGSSGGTLLCVPLARTTTAEFVAAHDGTLPQQVWGEVAGVEAAAWRREEGGGGGGERAVAAAML